MMNLKVTTGSRSSLAGFVPVRGSRDFGRISVMQRPRNLSTVKRYIRVLYDFSCVLGNSPIKYEKKPVSAIPSLSKKTIHFPWNLIMDEET
jgi:hypothetical protein